MPSALASVSVLKSPTTFTITYQLSECLSEDELAVLAADLVVLSDMLANIAARKAACSNSFPSCQSPPIE